MASRSEPLLLSSRLCTKTVSAAVGMHTYIKQKADLLIPSSGLLIFQRALPQQMKRPSVIAFQNGTSNAN